MDVDRFLARVRANENYGGQIRHLETLPARDGHFAEPDGDLPVLLQQLLRDRGIDRLYSHQAASLDVARSGHDLVVVTGTASGKTLCYNLPILECCLQNARARALYLFPTKALAQDQQRGLLELLGTPSDGHKTLGAEPALGKSADDVAGRLRPGVYDGDTSVAVRRRIKSEANLVLSNPDMLHASILPYHPKWGRFFSELRYVVLDEVHMYRGILGAHVASVLRRLQRVCEHYGSQPIFIAASATIANPGELTSRLVGRDVTVVDNDGSPRGRKHFALWDATPAGAPQLEHRSASDDAVWLMAEAMQADAQALAFTRTRQAAELVNRYVQQHFADMGSPLRGKMRAYRGGYLPNERRQIERELSDGELRGVAATNALELGVDIGSLDVALLVQYPGTIASAWQQAGRSGRRAEDSLAILLAGHDPVDQYLLRHPDYFFSQSPEHAVVDPENPYVLARHLEAAAFELPLDDEDVPRFGSQAPQIADVLDQDDVLAKLDGQYYFTGGQNPANGISLRHMSDNTVSIVLCTGDTRPLPSRYGSRRNQQIGNEVIANVDLISAPELVYPEAVYLHNAQSYFVRELDLEGKVAYVERREMSYYTQAILESSVKINETRDVRQTALPMELSFGDVDVSWKTVAFKKIKFETRENIGFGSVDIPAQNLPTTALWVVPDTDARQLMKRRGHRLSEGLSGLRNLAVVALPMVAMCDSRDVSGVVDSKNLGRSAMILYDRYPGGLGYCEKGYQHIDHLLALCQEMVQDCECEDGCPSCVGLPNLRPAIHSDPDLARGYPIPDKAATLCLLEILLGDATVLSTDHGLSGEA